MQYPSDEFAQAVLGEDVVSIFENLYAAYADDARRAAFRVLQDPDHAADAVQSAFVELLRYVLAGKRWHDPADARNAVLRNTQWAALKIIRARHTRPEVGIDSVPEPSDEDVTWARAEARALCEQIVGRLRPTQQEALHLHFVQGLTAPQCAGRLGLTTGAFEARLRRALRSARRSARALGVAGVLGGVLAGGWRRLRRDPRRTARLLRKPAAVLSASASTTALVIGLAVALQGGEEAPPLAPVAAAPDRSPGVATPADTPLTTTIVDALWLPSGVVALLGEGDRCSCGVIFASQDAGRTWQGVAGPPRVRPTDRLAVTPGSDSMVFVSRRDGSTFTSPALSALAAYSASKAHSGDPLVSCEVRSGHSWCSGRQAPGSLRPPASGPGWMLVLSRTRLLYLDGSHHLHCSSDGGSAWRPACAAAA